ncbi:MAG: hypothetical protein DRJ01_16685, partial [Bacteroidetes bacterium]
FRSITTVAEDSIIMIDNNGCISFWNKASNKIFGYTYKEVMGKEVHKLIIQAKYYNDFLKGMEVFRKTGKGPFIGKTIELIAIRKDRTEFPIELSLSSIFLQGSWNAVAIIRDITERKQQELQNQVRAKMLDKLRSIKTIEGCLKLGCESIRDAGLFERAVLTLHNEKRDITHFGQVGLDPKIVEQSRKAPPLDKKLVKKITRKEFRIFHSYFVPKEANIAFNENDRYIPEKLKRSNSKDSWKPGDELFVPIISIDGLTEGYLSVDTPINGKRPDKETILYLEDIVDIITRQIHEIKNVTRLRKSEHNYRTLFENTLDGLFVIDAETMKIVIANKAAAEIYGLDYTEDYTEINLFDFIPKEEKEQVRKIIVNDMFENDLRQINEFRSISKQGKEIWINAIGTRTEYQGKLAGLVSIRDITKRKQAEKELKKNEKKYRNFFETSKDCVFISSKDGKWIDSNEVAIKFFGYKDKDDLLKSNIPELYVNPENRKRYFQLLEQQGFVKDFAVNLQKRDGCIIDALITAVPIRNEKGDVVGSQGTIRDITENNRNKLVKETLYDMAEAVNTTKNLDELYTSIRNLLSKVIDTKNFYIALYDKKTDTISIPYQVDKKDHLTSFPADKSLTAYIIRSGKSLLADEKLQNRLVKSGEIELIGTPSKVWVGSPLKIEEKIIGIIAVQSYDNPDLYTEKDKEILEFVSEEIAHAIERKKYIEMIKNDLEEKNVLMREIHHRVKNNLQIISSLLKMQLSYIKFEEDKKLFLDTNNRVMSMSLIHEQLYRAKDLSSIDFNDYIRIVTRSLTSSYRINTNLIQTIFDIRNIYLEINMAVPCGFIINELISNALKFAFTENRKGKIKISFRHYEDNYELIVSDNGIGIPEEINLENVQSLGLQLVKTLTLQLHGTIELQREKGTKFIIRFKKVKLKTYKEV